MKYYRGEPRAHKDHARDFILCNRSFSYLDLPRFSVIFGELSVLVSLPN